MEEKEKRITAMYFEEEDDFPEKANKPESGQIPSNQGNSQNPPDASKSNSQLADAPVKNPVQPEKSQDSKLVPASPAGNESESAAKLAASTSQTPKPKNRQFPESPQTQQTSQIPPKAGNATGIITRPKSANQEAQKSEKNKRIKKTDAERLQLLKEKLDRKIAGAVQMQREAEILQQKIAWAEKSPEEKRTYERELDAHCKIIAGAIAIKLFNSKNTKFDRETFKEWLIASLSRPEDIRYFNKKLHD